MNREDHIRAARQFLAAADMLIDAGMNSWNWQNWNLRRTTLSENPPLDETRKVSDYTSNEKEQGIKNLIGEGTWRLTATVITRRRW